MPIRISFAGKGGTGKTTLAALLINYLIENNRTPILAVDADPNANLNELLGVDVEITLREIKDEIRTSVPEGMPRYSYVEMRLNQAIIEAEEYDLLVMGQPEGPGCYCPAYAFLSQAIEKLLRFYKYIVMDNEAGMEHISRLNLAEMEHLIIISDATLRGIQTAGRISKLVFNLPIKVERCWLIVNRCPQPVPQELRDYAQKIAQENKLQLLGFLPEDPNIIKYEINQIPVFEWKNSILKPASYKLWDEILNKFRV